MAITQSLYAMDVYFKKCTGPKVILNTLNPLALDDIELVNNSLMTTYNTDILSTVPSCDCSYLTGRFYLDKVCPDCGSTVTEVHKKVDPLMWLETLDNSIYFINPVYYLMLRYMLDKKIDYLRWMADPKYNPPIELPNFMYGVREILGEERSYQNMINKMADIIHYLQNHSKFKDLESQEKLSILLDMWKQQKSKIFSRYLPIVNKKLFVMENTTKGKFINLAVADVMDVIMTWIKVSNDEKPTLKKQQQNTILVLHKLSALYYNYLDKYIVKKIGAFRKHVFGARSAFTFRSVITSIPGPHCYDEIRVPWSIGVTAFRPHILNKLLKRGYTYKECNRLLFRAVKKYIDVIAEILQELIDESPEGKLWVLAQRNPSLLQGSSQMVWISEFKKDITDLTISISPLIIKAPNGDFDGDELNFVILLDDLLYQEYKTLKPYYNIPDMTKPFTVCGNLTLLSPANSIMSNYLLDREEFEDKISSLFEYVDVNIE